MNDSDFDPLAARELTERLVALPSVSPDPTAESRCAETLAAHLPAEAVHGVWSLPDQRPVVWALLPGRGTRTVILLGHYDTVPVSEFASLGAAAGDGIAFQPALLRQHLLEQRRALTALPEDVAEDLDQDAREPGTWLFGRGALDMKSGLAAGVAVLDAMRRASRPGHVLFVATPDEEHASAGMKVAVDELVRLREERGLDYAGVINLDYTSEPCAHHGLAGKLAVGCYVAGVPAHAGAPEAGVDAAQLAAAIALEVTTSAELANELGAAGGGHATRPALAPPTLLQIRDLKANYDVQIAGEALVEFNVLREMCELDRVFAVFGRAIQKAASRLPARPRTAPLAVHLLPELMTPETTRREAMETGLVRAREAVLARVRVAFRERFMARPAVVLFLMPPFYPSAAPRTGPFATAVRGALQSRGIPIRGVYPFISDASYVAWRAEPEHVIASHMPVLGREYRLPFVAASALDLDVVNLGPWGRGAHGVYERVHAPYAFETLPRLVAECVHAVLRE